MHLLARDPWKTLEQPKPRVSDFMPWLDFPAPGVVINDDESLQATLLLSGPDLRQQPPEVQAAAILQTNNALRQIDWGWSLHSETLRFIMPPPKLVNTWQHPTAEAVASEHRDTLVASPLLESTHYVTLRYAPPSRSTAWLEAKMYRNGDNRTNGYVPLWRSYLSAFVTTVDHLGQLLQGIMERVERLGDQSTLDYLASATNLRPMHIPLPEDTHYLAEQVDETDELIPGDRWSIDGRYIRTVTMHQLPHTSVALMLAALNDLDIEYSSTLRWIPHDVYHAQKTLQQQQQTHWFHRRKISWLMADRFSGMPSEGGNDPLSEDSAQQVQQAQVFVGTDQGRLGKVTVAVTVWDEDWAASEQKVQAVRAALVSRQFGVKVESTNALGAFCGSRPGVLHSNPRRPTVHSVTATHLLAVDAVYCGPESNPHWRMGPLFIGRTGRSNPYRYVPHLDVADAAHTFFWGPTGSGKTTWKDWLRVMCQQVPGIQDIGYDVKGSSRVTTLMLSGRYDDLGKGDVSLQPYRDIDQPLELEWAIEWTIRWLRDLTVRVDPDLYRVVGSTLKRLALLEPSRRTISGFLYVLSDRPTGGQVKLHKEDEREIKRLGHQRERLRMALEPFKGGLLDGTQDGLVIQRVHTFELETLLDMPMLAKPVLRLVDHRVGRALDGRPTVLWYDEIQALLDLIESVDVLKQRINQARDKNVMLLAGTPDISQLLAHRLAQTLLNNCPHKVLFPNREALSARNQEIYTDLGMTVPQMEALASALPRAQWLHKSPLGTRLVEHRLAPLALAVCGRSGKQWHQVVDRVLAEVGPELFPAAWLKEMEVDDATVARVGHGAGHGVGI